MMPEEICRRWPRRWLRKGSWPNGLYAAGGQDSGKSLSFVSRFPVVTKHLPSARYALGMMGARFLSATGGVNLERDLAIWKGVERSPARSRRISAVSVILS